MDFDDQLPVNGPRADGVLLPLGIQQHTGEGMKGNHRLRAKPRLLWGLGGSGIAIGRN